MLLKGLILVVSVGWIVGRVGDDGLVGLFGSCDCFFLNFLNL